MKTTAIRTLVVLLTSLAAYAQSPLSFVPSSVTLNAEAGNSSPVGRSVRLQSNVAVAFLANSNQGWVSVFPPSGVIPAGGSVDLFITADPNGLFSGDYTAVITAIPQNGAPPATMNVTLSVVGLTLFAKPDKLNLTTFPDGTDGAILRIAASDGTAKSVEWIITTKSGGKWLSVLDRAPVTTPSDLNIVANAAGLDTGLYEGDIYFYSTTLPVYGKRVPVTFDVRQDAPRIRVVPTTLSFYTYGITPPPPQPVQIYSDNELAKRYTVTLAQSGGPLSVNPMSGTTPEAVLATINPNLVEPPRDDAFTINPVELTTPVRVKVKTMLEPARRLTIQQIADGGGFRTRITIVNGDSVPVRFSLKFFKADPASRTTSPWDLKFAGDPPLTNVTIPVGASWSGITTGAAPGISAGWAEVVNESKGKISGNAVFQFLQLDGRVQEAAVPVGDAMMQRLLLPFDNRNGFITSFAIINKSATETAPLYVAFRDDNGRLIRFDRMEDLPAGGHYATELVHIFPYLNGLSGTMDLTASAGQISLLGLRFNPTGAFTSFEAQSYNRRDSGSAVRTLSQVADGGEFRTSITLLNQSHDNATVNMRFYKSAADGSTVPWTLNFDNGTTSASSIVIPPGTAVTLRTKGDSAVVQQGWGEILSGFWVTGHAVFEQKVQGRPDQEAAVPFTFDTSKRYLLPFDNTTGFTTSVAIANADTNSSAAINFRFRDAAGATIATGSMTLPVRGHTAFNLVERFAAVANLRGTMEISATSGSLAALGLRFSNSGAYTTFKTTPLAQF